MLWLVAADLVTIIHAGYVAFVVIGFVAIVVGGAAGWHWVRNFYVRVIHLAMILVVCCEALIGTTCPLTIWENMLRVRGGESGYPRDFVGYWLDRLIFYQAPPWVFTTIYLTFGAAVLLAFWFVPIRWPAAKRPAASNSEQIDLRSEHSP
jgi:Protein of Unknown function (DUF2784)